MATSDGSAPGLETLAAVGEVAARVAHEIGNSLSGIQYSFLLIKDAVPPDHPQYFAVAAIEREISRIAAVTRQFYETYYPEMDERDDASLTSIVGDAAKYLEQANRTAKVRVLADIAGAPGVVPLPAALLRLVVYSLAQHAIDAAPAEGKVTIVARIAKKSLEIQVASSEARPDFRKMGLGLSLVRRTTAAVGGTIEVHKTASGGIACIATLPIAK